MNLQEYVGGNAIGFIDPLGLEGEDQWHHLGSKGVLDPENPGSTLSELKMRLDPNVNIHSKEYGWVLSGEDHTTIDRLKESWGKDMEEWLRAQHRAGVTTITKEMLNEEIKTLKSKWKLVDKTGKALLGHAAEADWTGRSNYYSKIRKKFGGEWGKPRLLDEVGKPIEKKLLKKGLKATVKVVVPGLGILYFVGNVQADGWLLGTFNTVAPIDSHLGKEISDAAVEAGLNFADERNKNFQDSRLRKANLPPEFLEENAWDPQDRTDWQPPPEKKKCP